MLGTYDALTEADFDDESAPSSASISRSSSYRDLSSPEITRISGRPFNLDRGSNKNSYYSETESDESEDDEFVETFTFAKNISNPREVLTGQVAGNLQAADYLRVIGRDTGTECSLQKERKRRKRGTNRVACVHYPVESPPFSLYFCNIDRYALKKYVDLFGNVPRPFFVLLPVFKNSQGKHEKPKGLLDVAASPQVVPQWIAQQQLDERMKYAAINVHQKNDFSIPYLGTAPDNNTLWGENKRFVTRTNTPPSKGSSGPSSRSSTPAEPVDDFPALVSKPKKAANKTPTRRVIRLPTQKSAKPSKGPKKSQLG
ncbi:hypothetical protein K501DRAFT_281173, partial [Backusella circina FSU 941]